MCVHLIMYIHELGVSYIETRSSQSLRVDRRQMINSLSLQETLALKKEAYSSVLCYPRGAMMSY